MNLLAVAVGPSRGTVNALAGSAVFAALRVGVGLVFASYLLASDDLMQVVWTRSVAHLAAWVNWFNVPTELGVLLLAAALAVSFVVSRTIDFHKSAGDNAA